MRDSSARVILRAPEEHSGRAPQNRRLQKAVIAESIGKNQFSFP